jgi:uncharacterized membrane protein (UPF0127 family)
MKNKEVVLKFGNKKKSIFVNFVPWWYEGIGLMFKGKNYSKNLLFSFGRSTRQSIHSIFVFHKFLAIWCDEDFNVLQMKEVDSWKGKVVCRRRYSYLIEIPFANFNVFSRRALDELLERFK